MNGSTKDVFAKGDIRMGEELCIAYQKFSDYHGEAERQKVMR